MNSTESMTFEEVETILRIIDATPHGGNVDITVGQMNLKVSKEASPNGVAPVAESNGASLPAPAPVEPAAPAAPPAPAAPAATGSRTEPVADGATVVNAPMTGVFYRQPSPDADPFVVEGQHIEQGDVLAIIEVMKLMNRITSPVSGTVTGIRGQNEQLVEHGQVLFEIVPDQQ